MEKEMEKYWIGDLCYVMRDEDWQDFCSVSTSNNDFITGDIALSNGIEVSYQGTAYGDGTYKDQFGNDYDVDTGLIGIIKLSDIKDQEANYLAGGHIFEFERMPTARYDRGVIIIGNVRIDTDYSDEDDGDYYV